MGIATSFGFEAKTLSEISKLKHKVNVGTAETTNESIFSQLTVIVYEYGQIFPEVRVGVEQQSWTLAGPEAQGDVFSSQCHVRVDGER